MGFEPTVAKGDTRSPGAPDSPLQHLSILNLLCLKYTALPLSSSQMGFFHQSAFRVKAHRFILPAIYTHTVCAVAWYRESGPVSEGQDISSISRYLAYNMSALPFRLSNQLVYTFSKCLEIVVYIVRCGFG